MSCPTVYKIDGFDKRRILSLILPALIESVLSLTFGAIDTVMLGHSSDSVVSLSAVGVSSSIVNLVICVLNGYVVGQTASVAWQTGSGDRRTLSDFVRQSFLINLLIGTTLSIVFFSFAESIVNFLNPTDPDVYRAAVVYYRIVASAFVFQYIMIFISGFFRGCGEARLPLFYSISANLVNVFLNYLLIYGKWGLPEMGIRGAAIATAISHVFGAVFSFVLLCILDTPVRFSFKGSFIPRWNVLKQAVTIGLGSALEQFFLQFGNVLYVKIIAKLPKLSLSANSVVQTINGYIWGAAGSLNVASTTLMGTSMGEDREDKCIAFSKCMYRIGAVVGIIIGAIMILFRTPLCALITDDEEVISIAALSLIPSALSALGICVHNPVGGSLRAAGDTRSPLIASFTSLWFFRVGIAFLCVNVLRLGIFWGWVATAADQWVRATINLFLFKKGNWKKRLINKYPPA